MADSWTCTICEQKLSCSCNSSSCAFGLDIRAHILKHDCQCDPCLDPNCSCQGKKCIVCTTRNYDGPTF